MNSVYLQNGIAACLMYIDFFSVTAQRSALTVAANCVQNMSADEFHYLRDSMPLLSGRLNHQVGLFEHLPAFKIP